jgi:hypothetical protein
MKMRWRAEHDVETPLSPLEQHASDSFLVKSNGSARDEAGEVGYLLVGIDMLGILESS